MLILIQAKPAGLVETHNCSFCGLIRLNLHPKQRVEQISRSKTEIREELQK